jgi:hypothetical protein
LALVDPVSAAFAACVSFFAFAQSPVQVAFVGGDGDFFFFFEVVLPHLQ